VRIQQGLGQDVIVGDSGGDVAATVTQGRVPFDQSRSRPSGESVSEIDNPRGLSDSPDGMAGG
jgi:hypothetical protein